MTLPRRRFLHLAAGAAALPAIPRMAWAQTYPARPVRLIVGYAAGGAADIAARLMCQWLSDRMGQQFILENRPGAGTNIGTEMVVRAAPDGHTILLISLANAINSSLYDNLNFNFIRDIASVGGMMRLPQVMVINRDVPAKTIAEFIDYAKANPGKLNMGSSGIGTSVHLAGELFMALTGVKMTHVPYRGTATAFTDLIAGQIQVMFPAISSSIEYIKAGTLRGLAATTAARLDVLPDMPAMGEAVPGYEASAWYGLGVPKGTSAAVVERLNTEMNAGLADPNIKARFAELGVPVLSTSPAEFGKLVVDETEKWAKVVKLSGAKAQ